MRPKVFSDPVHGFHAVPRALLPLVDAPEVQRLRRIRQLGVGYLVFPGAEHSRFGHALGAMALMHDALATLAGKDTPLDEDERLAALAAALLHDVGHGPFSHTLEHLFLDGAPHEAMSRALIVRLRGRCPALSDVLGQTLAIFDGTYARPFFHQLVSGQLDVDRLDYLRRDAYYTGVVEGQVGVDRVVKTLQVHPAAGGADGALVVEAKGLYAVENFLTARRLMYGQVYLHKTVLAGDHVLRGALERARELLAAPDDRGARAGASEALRPFLEPRTHRLDLADEAVQEAFLALDDPEIFTSLKHWSRAEDAVLADLSGAFLHRRLPAVTVLSGPPSDETRAAWTEAVAAHLAARGVDAAHVPRYLHFGETKNAGYTAHGAPIQVLGRDGAVRDFGEVSEGVVLLGPVVRPYVVHPKGVQPKDVAA